MIRRRPLLQGALALPPVLLGLPALAASRQPWSDAAFDAAQAAGRVILIEVTAPWCPTCRAQKPHIDAVAADPRLREALLLSVDFDTQRDALRRLNVRTQSTLIVFRGREELGRATGITEEAAIRALLLRGV